MVILFDKFNLPRDIFEVIFSTNQQKIVAKVLIDNMKKNDGKFSKTEMSLFATTLHDGELVSEVNEPGYENKKVRLSYNKRQFYDRILTPMKSMGIIEYDLYKKIYTISDDFQKELIRIGIMWKKEYERPYVGFNLKK